MKRALDIIGFYSAVCVSVGATAYILAHETYRKKAGKIL